MVWSRPASNVVLLMVDGCNKQRALTSGNEGRPTTLGPMTVAPKNTDRPPQYLTSAEGGQVAGAAIGSSIPRLRERVVLFLVTIWIHPRPMNGKCSLESIACKRATYSMVQRQCIPRCLRRLKIACPPAAVVVQVRSLTPRCLSCSRILPVHPGRDSTTLNACCTLKPTKH